MQKKQSSRKLLLLEDVRNLGRKGDLVQAKPGFVRNFLLPMKKALIADKQTIRLQDKLQKERIEQAAEDKKSAEILAKNLKGQTFTITVKSDTAGHLYGSVTALDIAKLLQTEERLKIERKNVLLLKPIKMAGKYPISLKLSEEVPASFTLIVKGDQVIQEPQTQTVVIEENFDQKQSEQAENVVKSPSEMNTDTNETRTKLQEEVEDRTKN